MRFRRRCPRQREGVEVAAARSAQQQQQQQQWQQRHSPRKLAGGGRGQRPPAPRVRAPPALGRRAPAGCSQHRARSTACTRARRQSECGERPGRGCRERAGPRHRRRVVLNLGEPQTLWRDAVHPKLLERVAQHCRGCAHGARGPVTSGEAARMRAGARASTAVQCRGCAHLPGSGPAQAAWRGSSWWSPSTRRPGRRSPDDTLSC